MTRHSHEDAIDKRRFEQLLKITYELKDPFDLQCRFVLIAAGRLGLRAGEITHIQEDWIDWGERIIHIPSYDPCECGACRSASRQSAACLEDSTFKEQLAQRWKPKTDNSARAVPFGFDDDVVEVLEEFFFCYDGYPASRSSINRRVDRVLEATGMPTEMCYPHALRATAATHHAYRGLPAAALQSLFGWADLETAMKYIRLSGGATAQALEDAHSD